MATKFEERIAILEQAKFNEEKPEEDQNNLTKDEIEQL